MQQNQSKPAGILETTDLQRIVYIFLTGHGYGKKDTQETCVFLADNNRSTLDFIARRINAGRDAPEVILADMIKQGVVFPLNNGGGVDQGNHCGNGNQNNRDNNQGNNVRDFPGGNGASGRNDQRSSNNSDGNNQRPNNSGSGNNRAHRGSSGGSNQSRSSNHNNGGGNAVTPPPQGAVVYGDPKFPVRDDKFGRGADQVRVYGSKAALQMSVIYDPVSYNRVECIMVAFADVDPSKPQLNGKNQFGWNDAVSFAMTPVEAVCVANVVLGRSEKLLNPVPSRKEYNPGIYHKAPTGNTYKTLQGEYFVEATKYDAPRSVKLTMMTDQKTKGGQSRQPIRVSLPPSERMIVASFILSRMKRAKVYEGLDAAEIIGLARGIL